MKAVADSVERDGARKKDGAMVMEEEEDGMKIKLSISKPLVAITTMAAAAERAIKPLSKIKEVERRIMVVRFNRLVCLTLEVGIKIKTRTKMDGTKEMANGIESRMIVIMSMPDLYLVRKEKGTDAVHRTILPQTLIHMLTVVVMLDTTLT